MKDLIERADDLSPCYHESSLRHNRDAEQWIDDACKEIAALRSELARFKEAAELLARDTWRLALGKYREYGTGNSKVTDFISDETMDNPTAVGLVERARDENAC